MRRKFKETNKRYYAGESLNLARAGITLKHLDWDKPPTTPVLWTMVMLTVLEKDYNLPSVTTMPHVLAMSTIVQEADTPSYNQAMQLGNPDKEEFKQAMETETNALAEKQRCHLKLIKQSKFYYQ